MCVVCLWIVYGMFVYVVCVSGMCVCGVFVCVCGVFVYVVYVCSACGLYGVCVCDVSK